MQQQKAEEKAEEKPDAASPGKHGGSGPHAEKQEDPYNEAVALMRPDVQVRWTRSGV